MGYVVLGETLDAVVLFRDAARVPVNTDALPTFRVYGPEGLVAAATGAAAKLDHGTITGATNATPIVVTDVAHGLTTGAYITVSAVGGNTAANGSFTVTRLTADTFSLDGSVGNGSYTSGGVWNVTGLYSYAIVASAGNGFEVGTTYEVVLQGKVSGDATAEVQAFIVV